MYGGLYLEVTDAKGRMAKWVNGDGQTMVVFSQYYEQLEQSVLPGCNVNRKIGDAWVMAKMVNGACHSRTQLPALPATPVSYTHLRAHETPEHLVCRLLLEKTNILTFNNRIPIHTTDTVRAHEYT